MAKLVVANWKMNPQALSDAKRLLASVKRAVEHTKNTEVVIAPPSIFLHALKNAYRGKLISFAAQNIFWRHEGSYTGEVSAAQVAGVGATYVIIGHAERRAQGVSDEDVRAKVEEALHDGLKPIIAVGEAVRDDDGDYLETVRSQVMHALSKVPPTKFSQITLAYEPVWAIGADEPPSVHEIYQMMLYIRKILIQKFGKKEADKIRVLYGGSVDESTIEAIMAIDGVDGVLVGRASLDGGRFGSLLVAADRAR